MVSVPGVNSGRFSTEHSSVVGSAEADSDGAADSDAGADSDGAADSDAAAEDSVVLDCWAQPTRSRLADARATAGSRRRRVDRPDMIRDLLGAGGVRNGPHILSEARRSHAPGKDDRGRGEGR